MWEAMKASEEQHVVGSTRLRYGRGGRGVLRCACLDSWTTDNSARRGLREMLKREVEG